MRILSILAAILLIVGLAFAGSFAFDSYFIAPGPEAQNKILIIEPGDSVSEVARALEEGGVIKSAFPFKLYVKLSGQSSALQAGVFDIKTGMSYAAIVEAMTQGGAQEVQITIPEGYTLKQIGETVRAAISTITEEEWNAVVGVDSPLETHAFVSSSGKPDSLDLEGYLFPDTYRFFADATAEEVAKKMIDTMEVKLVELDFTWPDIACEPDCPEIQSVHELLTFASIIEREVQHPEDMKVVAGLFSNRLNIGMALQADSTLTYVLGKTSAEMTTDDLALDSPYNTYKYPDLPPGPIANPGMNAIDAAAHPTETPYFYFLTTDDGTVIYAETFEEHVANKNQHLR